VVDPKEIGESLGRILANYVAGQEITWVLKEWETRIAQGRADDSWEESEQGIECFAELLDLLENTKPETARIKAARKAFFAAARGTMRESPLPLQYMRIVSNLSGGALLLLGATYRLQNGPELMTDEFIMGIGKANYSLNTSWRKRVGELSGLVNEEIVGITEAKLQAAKLIGASSISASNECEAHRRFAATRLTSLGIELCKFLEEGE